MTFTEALKEVFDGAEYVRVWEDGQIGVWYGGRQLHFFSPHLGVETFFVPLGICEVPDRYKIDTSHEAEMIMINAFRFGKNIAEWPAPFRNELAWV